MKPSLRIVIVNWNAGAQLWDCIRSIVPSKEFIISDVIVVDNGSTDDSLERIEQFGMPVSIIRNPANRGFAAACNQGATGNTSDYLLFLNPDTRLLENSLTMPVDFMQQPANSKIGICGIRLTDAEGNASTSAARFPTFRVIAGEIIGLTKISRNIFPSHLMTSSDLPRSCLVDQVIGAFFLIRNAVFVLCGGFDERFFVYFEEVDLSLRAKQLGYSSYFLLEASAFHKGGGCSERVKAKRLFYFLRSRILYARKHYSRVEFLILLLLTWIEFPLRVFRGVLEASWSDVRDTISAFMHLIKYFVRRIL
jgi:GT2 family glycosyltransferase